MSLADVSEIFKGFDEAYPLAADPIWWEEFNYIDTERLRDPGSRERSNVIIIFVEVLFYIALLGSFIPLAYSFSNPSGSAAVSRFHSDFWEIEGKTYSNSSDFWSWCNTALIPKLYDGGSSAGIVANVSGVSTMSLDSSAFSVSLTPGMIQKTDMVLMGPIRLRQVRVNEGNCSDDSAYRAVSSLCSPKFESGVNENRDAFLSANAPAYLRESFTFSGKGNSRTELVSESTGVAYPSDGFIVGLPSVESQSEEMLRDLEHYDWIDFLTAAVIVEVSVYHASIDTFAVDRILFEFPEDGVMHVSHQVDSFQSFEVSFRGANASQMTLNVINILWQLVGIISMILGMVSLGRRFFSFFWNMYDLALIVFAFAYLGLRVELMIFDPTSSFGFPKTHVELASLVNTRNTAIELQTVMLCFLFFRGLKLTLLTDWRIVRAARNSFWLTVGLGLAAAFAFIGFSLAFHVVSGYSDVVYSFVGSAFTARALSLLHVVWVSGTSGIDAFFNLWFIWTFYLILVPVLVVIGAQAWAGAHKIKSEQPKPHPFKVLLKMFFNWITRKTIVEPSEERTVSVSEFPKMIVERIYARRKAVRNRVAAKLGFFPADYNEQSDAMDLSELQRLLDEDPFVANVFGTRDAVVVADRLGQGNSVAELQTKINKKIDMLQKNQLNVQFKIDPRVEHLSSEIHSSLKRVQHDAESDIKAIAELIKTLKKSVEGLSTTVRRRSVQLN